MWEGYDWSAGDEVLKGKKKERETRKVSDTQGALNKYLNEWTTSLSSPTPPPSHCEFIIFSCLSHSDSLQSCTLLPLSLPQICSPYRKSMSSLFCLKSFVSYHIGNKIPFSCHHLLGNMMSPLPIFLFMFTATKAFFLLLESLSSFLPQDLCSWLFPSSNWIPSFYPVSAQVSPLQSNSSD